MLVVESTELVLDWLWYDGLPLIRDRPVNTGALLEDRRLLEWLRLFVMIPGMVATCVCSYSKEVVILVIDSKIKL